MKKRIFSLILIVLMAVAAVGCYVYEEPEMPEYIIVNGERFYIPDYVIIAGERFYPATTDSVNLNYKMHGVPAYIHERITDADIQSLRYLLNLRYLGIINQGISDISMLAGLTNMRVLTVEYNHISDVSALAGMKDMIQLNLSNNQIGDVSALFGLTNLTHLNINANPLTHAQIQELRDALPNTEIFSDHQDY